MRRNKVKKWFEENKTVIEAAICMSVAGCAGYFLGTKIESYKINNGISRCMADGFMLFTKPSENGEIVKLTFDEWSKATTEFYKK